MQGALKVQRSENNWFASKRMATGRHGVGSSPEVSFANTASIKTFRLHLRKAARGESMWGCLATAKMLACSFWLAACFLLPLSLLEDAQADTGLDGSRVLNIELMDLVCVSHQQVLV